MQISRALLVCLVALALSGPTWAGPKEIADPIEVINAPLDSLDVSVGNEVEGSNDTGDPLQVEILNGAVTVDNRQPIDVTERPPNSSYMFDDDQSLRDDFSSTSRDRMVPVASHMRGLSLIARASGGALRCTFLLRYPGDPALRPVNQRSPTIHIFQFGPGFQNLYVPLPDLFIGKDVPLTFDYRGSFATVGECAFSALVHMRPLPGSLQPPGGFEP